MSIRTLASSVAAAARAIPQSTSDMAAAQPTVVTNRVDAWRSSIRRRRTNVCGATSPNRVSRIAIHRPPG